MTTASDIAGLREALREARATISALPEGLEREVGLAALRLEATHFYKELVTTAPGLRDEDVAPLRHYVESLAGGEGVERGLATLDAQASKAAQTVLSDLYATLAGGALAGVFAAAVGVLSQLVLTAEQLGAWLLSTALVGGSVTYLFVRAGHLAGLAAQSIWIKSWSWASSLGSAGDRVLAHPRDLQAALWRAATGGTWVVEPFTAKARGRAKFVVGASWVLVACGAALVAWGVYEAADEWAKQQSQLPTVTEP